MDASTQTDPTDLSAILDELRKIREDTLRNSRVAEKYGSKGDAIFDLVDRMAAIIRAPLRLMYDARQINNL